MNKEEALQAYNKAVLEGRFATAAYLREFLPEGFMNDYMVTPSNRERDVVVGAFEVTNA